MPEADLAVRISALVLLRLTHGEHLRLPFRVGEVEGELAPRLAPADEGDGAVTLRLRQVLGRLAQPSSEVAADQFRVAAVLAVADLEADALRRSALKQRRRSPRRAQSGTGFRSQLVSRLAF